MSLKYARCAKPPPASWQDSADIAAHFVSNAPSSKFTTCLAATLTFLLLLDNLAHSRYQRSFTCLIILCPDFMTTIIFIDRDFRLAAEAEANHASQCSLTALEASGSGSPLQVFVLLNLLLTSQLYSCHEPIVFSVVYSSRTHPSVVATSSQSNTGW